MREQARSSKRVIRLLLAGLVASGLGAAFAASSALTAAAAACQGCVVVSAPTIGLNVTAQPGQQAVIDQEGGVAVYTPLTTGAIGGPGTVWLVGHRTTHGAVFNRVPTLLPGDVIDLIDDAGAHRYVVSRLLVVSESEWQSQVDINDTSRSLLILQTSHPDSQLRYLVEAFGTGVVPAAASSDAVAPPASAPETTITPDTTPPVPSPSPVLGRLSKFGSIKSGV
ncbi:MAG: sortase [Actinomycetia bacterium]|nr:sortase [Actinomycetes bacterium]